MCVFVFAPHLYSAIPGWSARSGCVIWFRFQLRPTVPGLGVGGCVLVCAFRLHPAIPGSVLFRVGRVLPDTFSLAVVHCVLCALPGFAASGGRCCLAAVCVP